MTVGVRLRCADARPYKQAHVFAFYSYPNYMEPSHRSINQTTGLLVWQLKAEHVYCALHSLHTTLKRMMTPVMDWFVYCLCWYYASQK